MKRQSHQTNGFSLVELAVVVVIIGLLIGGVIVGQSLLKTTELQAVAGEYARYTQAVRAFQDKHLALPGDFSTATNTWGAQHATASTCITTASTSKLTCNGDGNGRITTQAGGAYATTYYEQFRAWQHLANEGLVSDIFSGISTAGTYNYTIGTNVPKSKFSNAGWRLINYTDDDRTAGVTGLPATAAGDIPANLVLWFGGIYFENSNRMSNIITPNDARELDIKIDDGRPLTGKLVSQTDIGVLGNTCVNSTAYRVSRNELCALVFKTGL